MSRAIGTCRVTLLLVKTRKRATLKMWGSILLISVAFSHQRIMRFGGSRTLLRYRCCQLFYELELDQQTVAMQPANRTMQLL